ncbi:kelch-like protein 12-like [Stylonychia lemnae]|uniref:Kelch-like protein 12-like n=1 Tax=Stylonychia lemnae TaxID=5949 RepID=A0A078ABY4_STYLE|nr:kelch-like protein 12-like [Stylonychia lemnae]|eukprot:CDW79805.1 kelch-like protein 12-like [Stylonychia lemnae]
MGAKTSSIVASQSIYKKMLIIGGCELSLERNPHDTVEVLDDQNKVEYLGQNSLLPVRGPMAHIYNNKIYLFGGCTGPKQHIDTIQIYDLLLNQWSIAPFKMINGRSCFMLSNIESEVYILGGYNGYECLREVEKIDLSQDNPQSVILKNLYHPVKNGYSFYDPIKQIIYIIGGWDEKETQDKIFSYNPKTQEMAFVSYLPHKVEGHSLVQIDNFLYIFGGFDGYSVTDTIIRVDLKYMTSEVVQGCKLKYKRENSTSQILNGNTIIVAGGWNGNSSMDSMEVFKYDFDKKTLSREDNIDENLVKLQSIRNRPCSVAL